MSQFQVRKSAFTEHRILDEPDQPSLLGGEVRLAVEKFGFSANNISYAVFGDRLGYWQFFPPAASESDEWGVLPVWGFGVVVESRASAFAEGERIFGYFPPASELIVKPGRISDATFVDESIHRAELPAGYNTYRRVAGEPGYNPAYDRERMLLWPLFITSYSLWDALQSNAWYGARQLLIVSASSKTGIGLAYAAQKDDAAPPVLGLTSARNKEFVHSLPAYDATLAYEDISQLDAAVSTVVVDMSGNAEVLSQLYEHLGDNFRHCLNVGLTHWDELVDADAAWRERSEMFFAPSHIASRIKEWGMAVFNERSSAHFAGLVQDCSSWLQIRELDGLQGLVGIYDEVCHGRAAPQEGLIVNMPSSSQQS